MADGPSIGSAYLRIAPDLSGLNAHMVGLVKSSQWSKYGKVAGAAMGAGLLAGGILDGLYKVGKAVDDATDNMRTKTGATGKELEKLKKSFTHVVDTVPVDFGTASDAVAGLNQRLGLTGKPLTKLSKQVAELSKITGTDIQSNVQSITRLFGDWGVKAKDQTKTLDKLYRASEDTGISVSDLSTSMVNFGSPLRQLGIDFDHAAAMFGEFEQAGVNTQTLMPGLRFAIKAFSGGVQATTDDLKKWGVSMNDPQKALAQIMQMIKDAPNNLKANSIAFEVFGQRAGPDMAAAIREGHFELDDLIKSMDTGKDTISTAEHSTRDFSEQWTLFKNNLETSVAPAAAKVFGFFGDEMKKITAIFSDKNLDWGEKFKALADLAGEELGKLVDKAAELAPKVAGALVHGFLDAPVLAQLAVGGWLFGKLGGGSGLKALGQKLAATLFGTSSGGILGKLTGTVKPIPVYVVNSGGLPGVGNEPVPTSSPKSWSQKFVDIGKFTIVAGEFAAAAAPVVAAIAALHQNTPQQQRHQSAQQARMDPDVSGPFKGLTDGKINDSLDKTLTKIKNITNALVDPKMEGAGFAKSIEKDGILARDRIGDIIHKLDEMSPAGRKAAADTMIGMAAQFEDKGKLPKGSADKLRDTVVSTFGSMHVKSVDELEKLVKDSGGKFDQVVSSSKKLNTGVSKNIGILVGAVNLGLQQIGANTNKALQAFGVDPVAFAIGKGINSDAKKMARGGLLPGYSKVDNVPIMARSGEAILTPEVHQPIVNNALQATYGMGLNDLFRKTGAATGGAFAKGGQVSGTSAMLALANAFNTADEPYLMGGGHGAFLTAPAPVDCSGAVSAILHAGGLLQGAPMDTIALGGWGKAASGNEPLVVATRPLAGAQGHTVMSINGRVFGTSGEEPNGGAGWLSSPNPRDYVSGAVLRTMDIAGGVAAKLAKVILEGPDGPLKSLGQAALDKASKAAQTYIDKAMPTGSFGGGDMGVAKGSFSVDQMAGLWSHEHGPTSQSHTAGAVGMAESHGDPNARNPSGASGLWQILGQVVPGNIFNPVVNADNAVKKYDDAGGWSPWTTYTSGAYRQYLAKGGVVGGAEHYTPPLGTLLGQLGSRKPKHRHKVLGAILDSVRALGLKPETFQRLNTLSNAAGDFQDFAQNAADMSNPLGLSWSIGHDTTPGVSAPWQVLDQDGNVVDRMTDQLEAQRVIAQLESSVTKRFKDHTQMQWLAGNGTPGALQELFDLRNVLVRADEQVEKRQLEIAEMLDKAQDSFRKVAAEVKDLGKKLEANKREQDKTVKEIGKAQDALDAEQNKDRKHRSAAAITKYTKQIHDGKTKLAGLRDEHGRLVNQSQGAIGQRDALKDTVIPAMTNKQKDLIGLRGDILGSGSDGWDGLNTVQGARGPMGILKALPPIGQLGGSIFDVEQLIAGAGFPMPSVSDTTPSSDDTPSDSTSSGPVGFNINELLDFVQAIRYGVFDSNLMGIPAHHGGGMVEGPPGTQEVLRRLMPGEGVIDKGTMDRGLSSSGGEYELTITNWAEGTGYIRRVSDDQISERNRGVAAVMGAGAVAR